MLIKTEDTTEYPLQIRAIRLKKYNLKSFLFMYIKKSVEMAQRNIIGF